jgi:hypothetical protein
MRYTCETLSNPRNAVRELVFRPIYAGHPIRSDLAMFSRRIATAATLLVLFGAGCAGHGGTTLAAGPSTAVLTPAAPVVESTTTTSTTLAAAADPAPKPVAEPTPAVNAAPTPAPATIEVDYQPQDGSAATATITGSNGSHSKSLDSGAALFGGLPAGTYAVIVTVDSPSGNPSIGDARVYLNGGDVHVEPGQHPVITCGDHGCTGAP